VERELGGLTLTAYQLPRGTLAGYYPECNVLMPISHHDIMSKTPAKVDTCQDRGGACARLTAGPLTRPHFRLGSSGRSA